MRKFFSKLHWQVALSLALAIASAAFLRLTGFDESSFGAGFESVSSFIGKLFMRMLSMIVVPLVLTSVVCGSMGLGSNGKFVRIGAKTVLFYLITGFFAIFLSLFLVNAIAPGSVAPETAKLILGDALKNAPAIEAKSSDIAGVLLRLFPPNIVAAASDNTQLLGLIIFAVIMGAFVNLLPDEYRNFQRKFWVGFNMIFEKITNVIMKLLPIGVFGLTAPVCMRAGSDVIAPVAMFFLTVLLALGGHMFITMSLVLKSAGVSPLKHLRHMFPAMLAAFSTSSSIAALPVTLDCVEKSAKVPRNISSFTIPLGATVNMNGSALYECAAVVFISQIYASAGGAPLDILMQISITVL
ncbi:MAG: dicarboxylate/amino acid:cation symporter, partial [Opitutales bacterium]|nr:dicarboxylate/amino acid:cation symporter [Opitutales bacterium]